ncbi:hypothetical protein ZHAS_00020703 [Anopheles sinensis]|uniref:Uncharacterized protein n=1 Tax=Anopheles sinensis TaxID=74873 RepID=A0A084WQG8_ANOSI|nr:hypothetical protein ZHAS_00020703 [Anopheles sinensis]
MALNGSLVVRRSAANDIRMSLDLFHSRLGNQQFNHYPMKLPTSGTCDFIDTLRTNYKETLAQIENMPGKGECPVTPRTIYVRDLVFPTDVYPP